NVGTWVSLAKAIIPNAKIDAFEPYPGHIVKLQQRARCLPDVRVHPVALGSTNGSAVLRLTRFSDASSILTAANDRHAELHEVGQMKVPIWRLDDYCTTNKLEPPDLLKLDVQGFELDVLKGATKCIVNAT